MDSSNTPPPTSSAPVVLQDNGKTIAIVSYLTPIGLVIAIFMNAKTKSKLGAYHIRQMIGLFLAMGFAGVIMIIPILGWIVYGIIGIVAFVFWIMGLISAIKGEQKPIPLIGQKAQDLLTAALS